MRKSFNIEWRNGITNHRCKISTATRSAVDGSFFAAETENAPKFFDW
jgi:hypothetical protein